jgi:hypothetical protein
MDIIKYMIGEWFRKNKEVVGWMMLWFGVGALCGLVVGCSIFCV